MGALRLFLLDISGESIVSLPDSELLSLIRLRLDIFFNSFCEMDNKFSLSPIKCVLWKGENITQETRNGPLTKTPPTHVYVNESYISATINGVLIISLDTHVIVC